jgi:hypothetical protein
LRISDGRAVTTDGPHRELREVLVGFYVLETADAERALELAARIPAARLGGSIQVHPLVKEP